MQGNTKQLSDIYGELKDTKTANYGF
uniref:Uncharacterized protein n=1 Tax=Anguilla anguilla TaxID=7936 RepID=A0A0E9VRY4_ANGAN